jgi:lysozyme
MSRLKRAGIGLTVAGSLAIGIVGGYEGLRTKAYRDIVGVPTVCFGETRGVKMGDQYTVEECKVMLGDALVEFETGMRKCMTNPDAVPDKPYVAFLSLSYNIGIGAFCRSTLVRKVNAGDIRGGCNELLKWNRAGGRVIKGLTRRRQEERALCLEGVSQ